MKETMYNIIQALKDDRSRTGKEKILSDNLENGELKLFFKMALDPFILFYVKDMPKSASGLPQDLTFTEAIRELQDNICNRKITGNAARQFISDLGGRTDNETQTLLSKVISKKPDCGVSESTVNKIWPGLVPSYPCSLASPYDEKLLKKFNWENARIETKMDAKRANIVINNDGVVNLYSRQGSPIDTLGMFDNTSNIATGIVLDGELIATNPDGSFMNRQDSNGISVKASKGTISKEEAQCLHFVVWDVIPLEDFKRGACPLPHKTRFAHLLRLMENGLEALPNISLVHSVPVKNFEEANKFYKKRLDEGEEGAMLKDGESLWEDKRSRSVIKFKTVFDAALEVCGYKEGEGALKGNLGSLFCKTSDDVCEVDISGFSLKLRSEIWANINNSPVLYTMIEDGFGVKYVARPGDTEINVGSIIEVLYNMKCKDRNGNHSIYLPRFSRIRDDLKTANTYDEIP